MKNTMLAPLSNGHRLSWASRSLVIDHDVLTTYCGTISSTVVVHEQSDLATERERRLTTGRRAERADRDFRCPICCCAFGQAGFFISERLRHCDGVVFS